MLSAFWGRPIKMQASVVLPPSYDKSKLQKYPTVYSIHGYGGDHLKFCAACRRCKKMAEGKRPEMIYVYLNANNSLGHHVFADSVNNGPWGTALARNLFRISKSNFGWTQSRRQIFDRTFFGRLVELWVMNDIPIFSAELGQPRPIRLISTISRDPI